jgi:hypothetical protein
MAKKTSSRKKLPRVPKATRVAAGKKAAKTRSEIPQFSDDAAIQILPAGKENPRRKGSGPYQRYEVLLKSRKVSDFLKKQPKWRSTIYRAIRDDLIRVGKK